MVIVLLVLVFLTSFYLPRNTERLKKEVSTKRRLLTQYQEKVAENEKMKAAIANLNEQIGRYNTALAVYDSLVPGCDRWNKTLFAIDERC